MAGKLRRMNIFQKIIKNRILYYVALVLLLLNIILYIRNRSLECMVILALALFLSHQFTKNYTVDIFIGLLVTNVLFVCRKVKEGFKCDGKCAKNLSDVCTEMVHKVCKKAEKHPPKLLCGASLKDDDGGGGMKDIKSS